VGPPVTVALKPVGVPPVPAVLPANETSLPVKPVTASLKVAVKLIAEPVVGSTWPEAWLIVTDGAVVSTTKTFMVTECVALAVRVTFH
jgi:hypothetical protein